MSQDTPPPRIPPDEPTREAVLVALLADVSSACLHAVE
jgi:hypothetical protein